ncbi:hypothetical protein FIB11_13705 [Citrobacter portucalensis]|nr:hypothetical protein [Citrobacter portucalensis]MBI1679657.1 hypothetical protein [Citrobacter portucalensis]
MAKRASARGIRRDVSGILRAPRRMQVADAVSTYMRVPMGAGKGTISYTDKRNIIASGNTITIQPSGSDGINDYPAVKVQLIVFAETA